MPKSSNEKTKNIIRKYQFFQNPSNIITIITTNTIVALILGYDIKSLLISLLITIGLCYGAHTYYYYRVKKIKHDQSKP